MADEQKELRAAQEAAIRRGPEAESPLPFRLVEVGYAARDLADLHAANGNNVAVGLVGRDAAYVAAAANLAGALLAERDAARSDVLLAAGELLIPLPEPGTDMARVLIANRMIKRERDAARAEVARLAGELERVAVFLRTPSPPHMREEMLAEVRAVLARGETHGD